METGCVVGEGGIAEEGEGPWKKVGSCQEKAVACGEHRRACWDENQEEGEVHREGIEEEASLLEAEEPTLVGGEEEGRRVKFTTMIC